MGHLLGTFSRQVCKKKKKTNQMSEMSFLWFICSSVVWKSLRYLSIFSQNMSPISPKNAPMIKCDFLKWFLCWLVVCKSLRNRPVQWVICGDFHFPAKYVAKLTKKWAKCVFFYYLNAGRKFQSRRKKTFLEMGRKTNYLYINAKKT